MFGSLIRYLRVEEITDVQSKPALDCVADRFHTIVEPEPSCVLGQQSVTICRSYGSGGLCTLPYRSSDCLFVA
jgi:hypothetical protein